MRGLTYRKSEKSDRLGATSCTQPVLSFALLARVPETEPVAPCTRLSKHRSISIQPTRPYSISSDPKNVLQLGPFLGGDRTLVCSPTGNQASRDPEPHQILAFSFDTDKVTARRERIPQRFPARIFPMDELDEGVELLSIQNPTRLSVISELRRDNDGLDLIRFGQGKRRPAIGQRGTSFQAER
jgi:hypothetical protein